MTTTKTSVLLAWCRLIRLPNVPSAAVDVLLGYWSAAAFLPTQTTTAVSVGSLLLLLTGSCALYAAGMVLNDYFDLDTDHKERPNRPLPSGQISLTAARFVGFGLLACGTVLATFVSAMSLVVALLLAGTVLAYDVWLKRTPLGPAAMGSCRLLNVLLGMSPIVFGAAGSVSSVVPWQLWLVPLANGAYITGVTWFARQEATISRRSALAAGAAVILAGLLLHCWALFALSPKLAVALTGWLLFVCAVGGRILAAIRDPSPTPVQQAVKSAVLGLIPLDAVLLLGLAAPHQALICAALLPPSLLVGKWIYST